MMRRGFAISLMLAFVAGAAIAMHSSRADSPAMPTITLLRTPQEGIQPQTMLDRKGVLHMIYFKGDASAGDIEYVLGKPDGKNFSKPIRVNSDSSSAVAIGTVRGPQMAVGRNGSVYVIWFGARAQFGDPTNTMPVFFSRLNDSRNAFEAQRNLMQYATGGDGGISIAADGAGDVYVVWHATGAEPGEDHRQVYLARSTNDGKTYAREVPISPPTLGT